MQDTPSCAMSSMVTSEYAIVNTMPLTLAKAQFLFQRRTDTITRKLFEVPMKHFGIQSESSMIIPPVHQIHPYFLENSSLLCCKFLYPFLASPWTIIFFPGKNSRFSTGTYGSKKCFYYLLFPHCITFC